MSEHCKSVRIPLVSLKPAWVTFTTTKGVLRLLRPKEPLSKAQGLIFQCPRCKGDKKKEHYLIFLLDLKSVPEDARPLGRFWPSAEQTKDSANCLPCSDLKPHSFDRLSLFSVEENQCRHHLVPQDMVCKWEGKVFDGQVLWRPTLFERWKSGKL